MLLHPAIMSLIWDLRGEPAVRCCLWYACGGFRRPHGAGPRLISNGGLEPATIQERDAYYESMHRLEPNMRRIRKSISIGNQDVPKQHACPYCCTALCCPFTRPHNPRLREHFKGAGGRIWTDTIYANPHS